MNTATLLENCFTNSNDTSSATAELPGPPRQMEDGEPTAERIMQIAWGYAPTLIVDTALKYRVFDLLDDSPKTAREIAGQAGASERGMTAILNALVSLNFLRREAERYVLTAESSAFLVSTSPKYHGSFFQHTITQLIPRWLQLPEAVRTGRPVIAVNEEEDGAKFFATFVESLFPLSYAAGQLVGEHLNLREARGPISVLDIGAGSGVWGIALAQTNPQIRIHAVDWPRVLEVTKAVAHRHGLGERLTTAPGDLLEADFGRGHTVATVGHILHSEGRVRSKQLLRRIFEALAPGGTIVISEFMPNEDRTGPPNALIFGVNMLINTECGDVFTFPEIASWLGEAGFSNPRLLEAPAPSPLVLATKAG